MRKSYQNDNPIVSKSLLFAVKIVKFTDLLKSNNIWNLSDQLLKSGTSIGANIRESQNAESKSDFIHKLKISAKEVEETKYWLELIELAYENYDISNLYDELDEIAKILNSIIANQNETQTINEIVQIVPLSR